MVPPIADAVMHDTESSADEYDENADEDFNPEKAAAEEEQSSSSDEDEHVGKSAKKPKKRQSDAVDDGLDSGDEATIKEQKRKKRKKSVGFEDGSAGEGGFIMTRAQRTAAKLEKKDRRRVTTGDVTIDVDKMWAEMSATPVGISEIAPPALTIDSVDSAMEGSGENTAGQQPDQLITIKRRIEYAGEVTEVEEQVPRASKEAQRYLAEHPEADPDNALHPVDASGLLRPLKRPSMFEPNPLGAVKGVPMEKLRPRAPSRIDVLMAAKKAEDEQRKRAQRMTTVQKSALDWEGFVKQEGFREELDEYGKSKRGYLAREAFLDRAAGVREQAARDARLKL